MAMLTHDAAVEAAVSGDGGLLTASPDLHISCRHPGHHANADGAVPHRCRPRYRRGSDGGADADVNHGNRRIGSCGRIIAKQRFGSFLASGRTGGIGGVDG